MNAEGAKNYVIDALVEQFAAGRDRDMQGAMTQAAGLLGVDSPRLDDLRQLLHDSNLDTFLNVGSSGVNNEGLLGELVQDTRFSVVPRIRGGVEAIDPVGDGIVSSSVRLFRWFTGNDNPLHFEVDRSKLTDEGTIRTSLDPKLMAWSVLLRSRHLHGSESKFPDELDWRDGLWLATVLSPRKPSGFDRPPVYLAARDLQVQMATDASVRDAVARVRYSGSDSGVRVDFLPRANQYIARARMIGRLEA